MSTNVDISLTILLATVEDLAEPMDAASLLRELNDRLELSIGQIQRLPPVSAPGLCNPLAD